MALVKLKKLDYSANYAFAPPEVISLANTDEIVRVSPIETRRMEKCSIIEFKDKETWTVIGTPNDIYELMEEAENGNTREKESQN